MKLACDKSVFSVHFCFVQYLSAHCPSGGRNAIMLATTFKTDEFRSQMVGLYDEQSHR